MYMLNFVKRKDMEAKIKELSAENESLKSELAILKANSSKDILQLKTENALFKSGKIETDINDTMVINETPINVNKGKYKSNY